MWLVPFTTLHIFLDVHLTQLTRRTMSSALQSYVLPAGVVAFHSTFNAPLFTSEIVMSLGLRSLPILCADSLCKLSILLAQPAKNKITIEQQPNNVFIWNLPIFKGLVTRIGAAPAMILNCWQLSQYKLYCRVLRIFFPPQKGKL